MPEDAVAGISKLRIASSYDKFTNDNACGSLGRYGEVQDYAVEIALR